MGSTLRYAKLHAGAFAPQRKHSTDAGADVFADATVTVNSHTAANIPTGLTFECEPGYMLLAKPKGKNKHLVGAGVGDALYQGEYIIRVVNFLDYPITIERGDPIAQIIKVPICAEPLEEIPISEIHKMVSGRGASGGIHSNN